jgi:hypothetical protein
MRLANRTTHKKLLEQTKNNYYFLTVAPKDLLVLWLTINFLLVLNQIDLQGSGLDRWYSI